METSIKQTLRKYANWHINSLTGTIEDYLDDDPVENRNFIGECKEQRELWKDVLRILDNESTYIEREWWDYE